MAFVKRVLKATVALGQTASGQQPTFQDGLGSDAMTLSGLRMSARCKNAGGASDGTLDLTIWGMTPSQMAQLSTLGMQVNLVPTNRIILAAGDEDAGTATAFAGYITFAYADYCAMPEVCFRIMAQTGLPQGVVPAEATSFKGSADVATIMSGLATQMGLQFENSGVTAKLMNPYFSGSAKQQAQNVAKAAGISMSIINGVLAIWPKNGSRGGEVPVISVDTGMIGYPTFTAYGLLVDTIYNTSIGLGRKVKIKSTLQQATGEYSVFTLDHELDCLIPNGKWLSHVAAYNPSRPTPVVK